MNICLISDADPVKIQAEIGKQRRGSMHRYYQEIYDYVRRQINAGEWPLGYKLPREIDMCTQFDVSRNTVRRALDKLVQEGCLKRIKGTGTFVTRPQYINKTTLFLQSFAEELRDRGETPVTELVECRFILAEDEEVIRMLDLAKGDQILKLRRLRYSLEHQEKGAMALSTVYFPMEIGEVIQKYDLEKESLTQILYRNGIFRKKIENNFMT